MSSPSRSDTSHDRRLPREGHAALPAFELAPERLHLNHGSFGAVPRSVLAEQQSWRERFERDPTGFYHYEYPGLVRDSATVAARCFGGEAKDWVFCENATVAANSVLASFPLRPGDEVLVTSHGYGAVVKAAKVWAERRDAILKTIPFPPVVESRDQIVELVTASFTGRSRLLIIDHITSATALVLPVEQIVRKAHDSGIAVLVDGAHAPGQLSLDVPAIGADWYTGNAHKWFFAPRGCGLLWTRPDHQDTTLPAVLSHGTDRGYTAAFDWVGTRDASPWFCLEASAAAHESFGGATLMIRNRDLATQAGQLFEQQFPARVTAPPEMRGSMVSLDLGHFADAAERAPRLRLALHERGIVAPVSALDGHVYLRLSAQIYNEMADYSSCASALSELGLARRN